MKQPLRRMLCLLLCFVMLCLPLPVSAMETPTPVIVVSGMGSFPLYDGESGKQVWGPETKTILQLVGETLLPIGKAIVRRDFDLLADETFDKVYGALFEIIACDETGAPKHPVESVLFPQSADHYQTELLEAEETEDEIAIVKTLSAAVGAEHVYFFNYDWRLSPLEHVDALHEYIERVKQEQNADKVTLVPCSMGGTVVNGYLSVHGSGDIEKIVYCLTACKGIDLVGELFGKNIAINVDTLLERLFNFENGNAFVQALLGALKTGFDVQPLLICALDKLVATVLEKTSERAYRDILSRSFASMPGMWAFVPDAYYQADKEEMFSDGGNPVFLEKIDAYHDVQVQSETLMQAAMDSGTQIYITAAYGFVGFPVTKQAYAQGDCLIETHNESFGARTALYGKTLRETSLPEDAVCLDPSHDHLSDDLIVDASTCAFPEQTWFFKHMKHVGFPVGSGAAECLTWLVTSEEALTVQSDPRFPQFQELNLFSGKTTSLTGGEKKAQLFDKKSDPFIRFLKIFVDIYFSIQSIFHR